MCNVQTLNEITQLCLGDETKSVSIDDVSAINNCKNLIALSIQVHSAGRYSKPVTTPKLKSLVVNFKDSSLHKIINVEQLNNLEKLFITNNDLKLISNINLSGLRELQLVCRIRDLSCLN